MADRTKVGKANLGRILEIVKTPNANPAKLKTAFLSVTGEDLRSAGWTVDELREALQRLDAPAEEAEAPAAPKGRSRRPAPEPEPEDDEDEQDDDADEDSDDDEDDSEDDEDYDDSDEDDEDADEEDADEEDDEPEEAPAPRRSRAAAPASKPTRTPAQIAATEKMRAANAAKANGTGAKGKGKGAAKSASTRTPKVVDVDPVRLLKKLKAEDPDRWEKVKEITEVSAKGRALRVLIRTRIPQTGDPRKDPFGKGTREIAVQDMFQVHYSAEDAKKARALRKPAKAPARTERKAGTGGKDRAAASTGTVKGNAAGGKKGKNRRR